MCREKGFGFVFLMTIPYLLERQFHPAGELGQLSGNEFFREDFTSLKKIFSIQICSIRLLLEVIMTVSYLSWAKLYKKT